MRKEYGNRADFLAIYIKEAHPIDEWRMESNDREGICYPQPTSLADRVRIANDFKERFDFDLPLLVDGIDNSADRLYAAWPERLYVVEADGIITYKGKPGPFGFDPEEVEAWLQKRFPPATQPPDVSG